jgi:hypothetical protein
MALFNNFDDKVNKICPPNLVQGLNIKTKYFEKNPDRWRVWHFCSGNDSLDQR